MAASFCQQFRALLWKSFLIRRRAMCSLAFELILPIIFAIILAIIVAAFPKPTSSRTNQEHEYMHDRSGSNQFILWEQTRIIHYAPTNKFTRMMGEQITKTYAARFPINNSRINLVKGYSTENEMIREIMNRTRRNYNRINTVLVYEGTTDQTNITTMSKLRYKLRSFAGDVPDPKQLFPTKFRSGPSGRNEYTSSFIALQTLLNEAFLDKLSKDRGVSRVQAHDLETDSYPYPSHQQSKSVFPTILTVSFFVVFGFMITFPIIVKRVTTEKLNKSRELFRMMGMTDWVYWLTTILMYLIIIVIQVIVITLIFIIKFNGEVAVINSINPIFIIIIFTIFGLNLILFALLISIPFSRPVLGMICSLILWIVTFILPMIYLDPLFNQTINMADTNAARIICCLLLPNFALSVAMLLGGQYDIYGSYATWSTLFEPIGTLGEITLGLVLMLMIMSSLLMSVLIWYLDNVWPWQDGVPKPIWFPFTKNYWFPKKSSDKTTCDGSSEFEENPHYFENFSSKQKEAIVIRSLRKKFGKKYAVDGVNLDIVHGQITCLLGHNGAGIMVFCTFHQVLFTSLWILGKTTMMSMITGIFNSDGGKISVNGYDVATQTRDARASMSLCPQHNVLYEELTVIEHLRLYAAIKGIQWTLTEHVAMKTATASQLDRVLTKFPRQLSGGMKRKLCLSIALVGDTSVVILDEPTSGLDPEARHAIWELLREVRRDRTILLTTHFMEEADALGDRIAIMSTGRISCYGTPMFLKRTFSTGYQLRVAKQVNGNQFNGSVLMSIVQRHFPNGVIKSDIANEVIISLESNLGQTDSSRLPMFLKDIEDEKGEIGIDAFGLCLTTLEDVFLKVGELAEGHETLKRSLSINSYDDYKCVGTEEHPRVSGIELNLMRFKGLVLKRYNYARRAWPSIIFQMIVPCLTIGLCFLATNGKFLPSSSTAGVLEIRQLYGETYGNYRSNSTPFTKSYKMAANKSCVILKEFRNDTIRQNLIDVSETTKLSVYITKHLTSVVVQELQATTNRTYTVWYNNEATHALPVALNLFYEALFRELSGNKLSQIELTSQPINDEDGQMPSEFSMLIIWLILISLSIPFLGASYSIFPTYERASKAKLLQLMTGLNPCLFWFASFLFDMSLHLITTVLIMITFAIMDIYGIIMVNSSLGFAIFILFVVYGLATIVLAYVFSNMFAKPTTVFLVLIIIYSITSIILTCLAYIFKYLVAMDILMTQSAYDNMIWYFRVSPVFSMAWATSKVYANGLQPVICKQLSDDDMRQKCNETQVADSILPCCVDKCSYNRLGQNVCAKIKNPFVWAEDGINKEIFMMCIICLIACGFLCVVEVGFVRIFYKIYYKIRGKHSPAHNKDQVLLTGEFPNNSPTRYARGTAFVGVEDVDVEAERIRVENLFESGVESDQEALLIRGLVKRFGNFTAVDGITFAVHNQECFGLLGVNGAGKTTTFRMLTGDLLVTSGDAICGAFSVNDSLSDFQQQLGYCPQFDALLNKLSGREMLLLFGRLRGIPEEMLKRSVDKMITMCDLSAHIDKRTHVYSGGNKRKLSLALALIGSPKILLLDEPTSGVDPGSRRHIWTTLAKVRQKFGCSIVLSSHSMDECEALCSRLGIMVNGQLKCLGSVQHIKDRYGQGYTVIIKLKEHLADTKEKVQEEFELAFKKCALQDSDNLLLKYHLSDIKLTWSHVFTTMENLKSTLQLDDYAVSDTTLDQIFNFFARGQQYAKK